MLMRAKMKVNSVDAWGNAEILTMQAVCKPDGYDDDGSDEDNTFARFTPSACLEMVIMNPGLVGKIEVGQVFYVDFTPVNDSDEN